MYEHRKHIVECILDSLSNGTQAPENILRLAMEQSLACHLSYLIDKTFFEVRASASQIDYR